jgi:MFS family permease
VSLPDSFSPLRNRNFALFLSGQLISFLGTFVQSTAQSLAVFELTRNTFLLGLVNALAFVPLFFLGPFAGAWSDRVDRRKLLAASQTIAALLAAIMGALLGAGTLQLWHVLILALALGFVNAVDLPAQAAMIGDLLGAKEAPKGAALNATVSQLGRLFGPLIAGLLIDRYGSASAFWVNAFSFVPVIISLLIVRTTQTRNIARRDATLLTEFSTGISYVRERPHLRDLFTLSACFVFFGYVGLTLYPLLVEELLSGAGNPPPAQTLGILYAAGGVGTFIASLVIIPISKRFTRTGLLLCLLMAQSGVLAFTYTFSHSIWLTAPLLAYSAFGLASVMILVGGLLQRLTPPEMRGRIMTLNQMTSWGMQLPGSLLAGLNGLWLGGAGGIRFAGIALFVSALAHIVFRTEMRRWRPNN